MPQITIQQAFDLAVRHHQAGRLAEAEPLYRQILARQPGHADALHMLGVIAYQVRRYDVAVDLIRQAIARQPNWPEAYYNLGNALKDAGRLDEAIAGFRQAAALRPNYAEAYNNLGNALKEKGRPDEAIVACRRAIALRPNYAEAYNNLGNALRDKGDLDQAIIAFGQALAMHPKFTEAHNNLGNVLKDKQQLDEAIAAYRQAIALNPNYAEAYSNLGAVLREKKLLDEAIAADSQAIALNPNYAEAYNNLGVALKDKDQFDEAIAAHQRAIALNPHYAEAYSNLGIALQAKGQSAQAIAACRRAIALKPDLAEAHSNLGLGLNDQGRLEEAIAAYRQAQALDPTLPDGHWNLALALLVQGHFPEGWEEYEWRWKTKGLLSPRQLLPQPLWDGRPLAGRAILLHAEQGLGDTIQFIRYLPLVAQRGGRVIVECQPELQRLVQAMTPDIPVLARGQPLPDFAFQCPLLSLPKALGTTLATIPATVPYLHADAQNVQMWRDRLAGHGSALKVGLIWAGNPHHKNDRNRSVKLASLAPLAQVPGVQFYSLQKGAAAAQAKTPPPGMDLIDRTDDLQDFADTAAMIANLDLVIAVDTSVVHLAGALAKPVWTLLPYCPDWRWLLKRQDSPWYPTMRLFRQPEIGDWDSVIQQLAAALANRLCPAAATPPN